MDSVIRFELMMKNGFAGRCLRPLGYTEKLEMRTGTKLHKIILARHMCLFYIQSPSVSSSFHLGTKERSKVSGFEYSLIIDTARSLLCGISLTFEYFVYWRGQKESNF